MYIYDLFAVCSAGDKVRHWIRGWNSNYSRLREIWPTFDGRISLNPDGSLWSVTVTSLCGTKTFWFFDPNRGASHGIQLLPAEGSTDLRDCKACLRSRAYREYQADAPGREERRLILEKYRGKGEAASDDHDP